MRYSKKPEKMPIRKSNSKAKLLLKSKGYGSKKISES